MWDANTYKQPSTPSPNSTGQVLCKLLCTGTLSYDQPAQCYYGLLSVDGSRGLSAMVNNRCTFICAVGYSLDDYGLFCCLLSLNLQCFSNARLTYSVAPQPLTKIAIGDYSCVLMTRKSLQSPNWR